MKKTISLFTLMLILFCAAFSQNHILEMKDLRNRTYYPTNIYATQFIGTGDRFSFTKDGQTLMAGEKNKEPKELLKAKDVSEELSLFDIKWLNDSEFTFLGSSALYKHNTKTGQTTVVTPLKQSEGTSAFERSGNNLAYIYEGNVYVASPDYNMPITSDGNKKAGITYGEAVHRNEFGIDRGFYFSANGNKLAFYRMDESMVAEYPLVNTAAREGEYVPIRYPMAGMKSHEVLVMVYDFKTQKMLTLKTRRNESVEEREMYLTNIAFSADEQTIYIQKLNRSQNHLWLEAYDANTGALQRIVLEETSTKYIEPQHPIVFLPKDTSKFLFFSERDGYQHLYLYKTDGTLVKQITSGQWLVKDICGFNSKGDECFFYATKDSPLEQHLYGASLKDGKITRYTKEAGSHNVSINAKGDLFIDSYSNQQTPAMSVLVDAKGKILQTLNKGNNPLTSIAMPQIELGSLKNAEGIDLYYRMIKPHDFDPNRKYPVIIYVYGGPHAQLVNNDWLCGGNLFFLMLAQQGYIVWTLDSRGSAGRGYDFESAIWHNCGSVEVADQMLGVNYLKSLPYVDSSRLGIDGWSYGGFMTISLMLKNPGVFKTATAGGPVIDWKWYEIMYGERYMGTPEENPEGYNAASLLNYVDSLSGKLLIIHGAQDNTVVMQHSLEFINACIKAGKQVDYFIYPDHSHNVGGKDRLHLYQKIFDFHKANL